MPASSSSEPRGFMRACIMLMLYNEPTHGYALMEALVRYGFHLPRDGRVYRMLQRLEKDGFVTSEWQPANNTGPRRRIYRLTDSGQQQLMHEVVEMRSLRSHLDLFFAACSKV